MTQAIGQPALAGNPPLPERLNERLEALGVAVVLLGADGRLSLRESDRAIERSGVPGTSGDSLGGPVARSPDRSPSVVSPSALERLLVGSPPFAAAVRGQAASLAPPGVAPGSVVEVWPGVWLAPLSTRRRRQGVKHEERKTRDEETPLAARSAPLVPQLAALLLGAEFLSSDQMHLVCDTAGVDYRATVAGVDPGGLFTKAQAQRLALALSWMHQDSLEIDRRFCELQTMGAQLGESYEELSLLYKLSTSMTVNQPPAAFLTDACRELRQVLGLKWMGLHLNADEPRLIELAGSIFIAGEPGADAATLQRIGGELLRLPEGFKPRIVDDTGSLSIPGLAGLAASLLVVPMLRECKPFGLLFGGDKLDGTHISSVDSKLCDSLANSLSIFLENRMLFEDMSAMFMGTLHALTSSIDAKDSYTKGHSERVAIMSRRLAAAAGLDEHTVERVYIAGLVHDVGKIGVPEAVLTKPGKLTNEEFDLIKLHPEIGARILRDIRQMQDLIPGVLYHHERWDGRGYPAKLAGDAIPLFGRLICLADSFDAMSSNRTYRKSLRHEQVLEEVLRCAGTQFDPKLAEVFVKLDFSEFFSMLGEHQKQTEADEGRKAKGERRLDPAPRTQRPAPLDFPGGKP